MELIRICNSLLVACAIIILFSGCTPKYCQQKTTLSGLDNFGVEPQAVSKGDNEQEALYDTPPEIIGGLNSIFKRLQYPKYALDNCIEGVAIIKALIDTDGNTIATEVLKEDSIPGINLKFGSAAAKAVDSIQWKPATRDGRPVKVWVSIPIAFTLQ